MRVDVTSDERDVLLEWKKRNDMLILVRLKAEAILYASPGVDVGVIAEMVDRCEAAHQTAFRHDRSRRK